MSTEWKAVRVPSELAVRIERLARELERSHVEGRSQLPAEFCERVPAHFVISRALDEFEGHRERSRRPARRSSGGGVMAGMSP